MASVFVSSMHADVITSAQAAPGDPVTPATNPSLHGSCGENVAIVVDLSGSMDPVWDTGRNPNSSLVRLKAAATQYVEMLKGSNTSIALYTFGSRAPNVGDSNEFETVNANHSLTSVKTDAEAGQVETWINGWQADGFTRWDLGLQQVADSSEHYDYVLFISDGYPTNAARQTITDQSDIITAANNVKAKGTRIIAIYAPSDSGSAVTDFQISNLEAISGTDTDDPNALANDYYLTDWTLMDKQFQALANMCTSTVPVFDYSNSSWTVVPTTSASSGTTPFANGNSTQQDYWMATLTAKDQNNTAMTDLDVSAISFTSNSSNSVMISSPVKNNEDGTYSVTISSTVASSSMVALAYDGQKVGSDQTVSFQSDNFSYTKSTFTVDPQVSVSDQSNWVAVSAGTNYYTGTLTAKADDETPLTNLTLSDIEFSAPDQVTITAVENKGEGIYTVQFSSKVANTTANASGAIAQVAYKGTYVGGTKLIPFKAGQESINPQCDSGKEGTNLKVTPNDPFVGQPVEATVLITDEFCNPKPGVSVNFSLDPAGSALVTPSAQITDENGKAYSTVNDATAETVTLHATITAGEVPTATTITFVEGDLDLTSSTFDVSRTDTAASVVVADGTQSWTGKLVAKDSRNNLLSNLSVSNMAFTVAPAGVTVSSVHNDGKGVYTVTYTSTKAGPYTATLKYKGQQVGTDKAISFVAGSVDPSTSTVTVNPPSQVIDAPVTVTVTAKDANNNPVLDLAADDIVVTGKADGAPDMTISACVSAGDGVFTCQATSQSVGDYTVQATVKETPLSQPPHVVFTSGMANPGKSELIVSPVSPIVVENSYTATATARDIEGNPVQGAQVSFTLDPTSPASLSKTSCLTGANGTCQVTITSDLVTTVAIHATVPVNGVNVDLGGNSDTTKASPKTVAFIAGDVCVSGCAPVNPANVTRVEVTIDSAEANGQATDVAKAYAYDRKGNAKAGVTVASSTTDSALGGGVSAQTGADGTALINYTSTVVGPHVATVTIGSKVPAQAKSSAGTRTDGQITLNFANGTASAADSYLEIDPTTAQDVRAVFTVTAYVNDVNQHPMSGVRVDFPAVEDLTFSSSSCVSGTDGTCQVTVTSRVAGTYTVGAKLNLQDLSNKVSAVFVATADTTAPDAPEITSPKDGDATNDNPLTVAGTGEPGATIVVKDGGSEACSADIDEHGDWSCEVSLDEGDHTLTATATDEAGNKSDPSAPVTITVDTTSPDAPEITSPKDGDATNDDPLTVAGTGEAGSTITVKDGEDSVCEAVVASDGKWSCEVSLDEGDHTLTATSEDKAGNKSDPSDPVTITVDTAAPDAPEITSPKDGDATNDDPLTVAGTGEAGSTITVKDGDKSVCETVVPAGGNWECKADLGDGDHTLTATSEDKAGNVSDPSDPVQITVDTTSPSGPVVDNSNGSQITGTTDPDTTVTVTDKDGNPVEGCANVKPDASGHFSCTPATPLPPKSEVTVTAKDAAGNTSDVEIVILALRVETAYDSRQPGQNQVVSGYNFNPGEEVCVYIGDEKISCEKANEDGTVTFSFDVPSNTPAGTQTVTLTSATSGNVSSSFTVAAIQAKTGGAVANQSSLRGLAVGLFIASAGVWFAIRTRKSAVKN